MHPKTLASIKLGQYVTVKYEKLSSKNYATVSQTGWSEMLIKYYATFALGLEKVLTAELSSPLLSV
jgi:hypothetical protein